LVENSGTHLDISIASDIIYLDGFMTILIPGTDWQSHGGWGPDNGLFGYGNGALLGGCAGYCTRLLEWSPSGNNDGDRIAGAQVLRQTIAAHDFAAGEKLNVITHSHGGNVALAAAHIGLARPIDLLITLNKPTLLGEAYVPGKYIESFYNISAAKDWVQWAGSDAWLIWNAAKDRNAVNHTIDTSGSNIQPHAALIWDDRFREVWWEWFLGQQGAKAAGK
jgi:hypothetical protein